MTDNIKPKHEPEVKIKVEKRDRTGHLGWGHGDVEHHGKTNHAKVPLRKGHLGWGHGDVEHHGRQK